jgi:sialic acid synthase SpsE
VTILHATDYAVPAYLANFATLRKLAGSAKGFLKQQWRWGLSDHTDSNLAAEIATTLGASMIEWHLRLAGVETPDDAFSWTRKEFEMKAKRIREIEEVLK